MLVIDKEEAQNYGRYAYRFVSRSDLKEVFRQARLDGCPERWLAEVEEGWLRERNDFIYGELDCEPSQDWS